MERVYLDNAATTPLADEVFAAMEPYLRDDYGNPSSLHQPGMVAARAVGRARQQVAELLGASPGELAFTSGGTEADNWALTGSVLATGKRHLVISAIEHHAVSETCAYLRARLDCQLTVLAVDAAGRVAPEALAAALTPATALVSIILGNNEVGTLQDVAALAAVAHDHGVPFHTDAVQAVAKVPIAVRELGLDLLSLSAHKFNGPKGVGALYIRKGSVLDPYQHGGGQESGRRAGTVNVPGVVGLGAAAALGAGRLQERAQTEYRLVEELWEMLQRDIPGIKRNGHPTLRLPNILNVSIPGVDAEAVQTRLDAAGHRGLRGCRLRRRKREAVARPSGHGLPTRAGPGLCPHKPRSAEQPGPYPAHRGGVAAGGGRPAGKGSERHLLAFTKHRH